MIYSIHTPLRRKTQAALPPTYFRNKPFRIQTSPTSCFHEIRVQPLLNISQCHRQSRHVAAQSASRVNLHTTELLTRLSSPCSAVKVSTLCCLLAMQLL